MLIQSFALLRRRRVPVILQLSMVECGAACLAMIMSFYGRRSSIAECREVCMPGRDGVNGTVIAKAARHFGMSVRAFAIQHTNFSSIQLPVIIHWNFNHFVILERWSPKRMTIVDPAFGRRVVSAEEFDRCFTGVVIACTPGPQFERTRTQAVRPWRTFASYLWAAPGLLAQIILASLLLQGVGFVLPILTKVLFDKVLTPQFTGLANRVLLGLILIALIKYVVQTMRAMLLLQFQVRCDTELMQRFFRHLLSLPLQFFEQRSNGDLLMRLSSNSMVREIITGQTLSILLDGAMIVVYLLVLAWQSVAFMLAVVVIGVVQLLLLWATNARVQRLVEGDLLAQSEAHSYLVEAMQGIATVKSAGAEQTVFEQWQNLFYKQINTTLQRARTSALIDSTLATVQLLTPLILLWLGLQAVNAGTMSIGTMLALNAIAVLALAPLNALIGQGQRFQVVAAYLERLFDVLQSQPEQPDAAERACPAVSGAIELEHVTFGYDRNAPPVLHDISLQIKPGQKVAIVGKTGSGKTTLAKLLLGLYQPSSGQIRYDGVPLEQCSYQQLRRQFGVVLQDSFLFSGSIRHNISFNQIDASLEQVVLAAQQADIHGDIARMPMGYETRIAEGSNGISGGQRQRLALARALVQRPPVLILDEATSHLDTTTERIVEAHLSRLDCTRIVIAHRLSTIRDADHILVIDQGRLVEQGTHAELLARNGHYATLLRNQLVD